MRIIFTPLPEFIIHIFIRLYSVLSFLLDTINSILSLIKKIKFKWHIVIALLTTVGHAVYLYYNQSSRIIQKVQIILVAYLVSVIIIKIFYKLFDRLCYRVRRDSQSYFWGMGLKRYMVYSSFGKKHFEKEKTMKNTYSLQLDFDLSPQTFNSLNEVFDVLKANGHIFVYDSIQYKEKYMEKAVEEGIDISKYSVYIETSTSDKGTFAESEQVWIETHMLGEFYYSDKMPYIETLI